jgi:hypothetical protein
MNCVCEFGPGVMAAPMSGVAAPRGIHDQCGLISARGILGEERSMISSAGWRTAQ